MNDEQRALEEARCRGYTQGKENGLRDRAEQIVFDLRAQPQTCVIGRDLSGLAVHGQSWAAAAAEFIERRYAVALEEEDRSA